MSTHERGGLPGAAPASDAGKRSFARTGTAARRGLFVTLIAVGLPAAALVMPAGPSATGATDPCAASEVARTIGSVAKQTGDYLDSHPETNQAVTAALQQPAGPESLGSLASLKGYFERNPKAAGDLQSLAHPLTNLSTQCKLPVTFPQALNLAQAAQGAAGLPGLPPAAGAPPASGAPAGTPPPAGTQPPAAGGPVRGR
ncbi:hemophore [Mycobacterium persicum]|uniref:hemophore n=1 Tax=Mycobacterium persicum TaxID=1487726 RepID=UPI000C06BEF4|nr:hemophore [Mycobacterium persicum]